MQAAKEGIGKEAGEDREVLMAQHDGAETSILQLVSRSQAGDTAALQALLTMYRPLLARCTRQRAASHDDPAVSVDDVAQESNTAFIELVLAYQPERQVTFGAYLKGQLNWRLHNWTRRLRATAPQLDLDSLLPWLEGGGREDGSGEAGTDGGYPSSLSASLLAFCTAGAPEAEAIVHLHDILARLSAKQRQVLYLRYWLDLPASEIATRLGLSVRAVDRLRERAERKIAELWKPR